MLQKIIETKLYNAFTPDYLEVINESHMHNVPPGSESHFKVVIVSREFEDLRLIARHRKVNQTLGEELQNGLHALSIHTYTESEWTLKDGAIPETPNCLGGNKK